MKKNKAIIFDGDDTLWKTQELYDDAKENFNRLMKSQGFNEDIVELLDEIDMQRVEILKFSKSRFLESMLITYVMLCGKYHKNWDIEVESKIRNIGESVFKFPPTLYEDTMETLRVLSEHFSLVLFTNGDRKIQKKKIDSLGKEFKSYFEKIYIAEIKNEEEYGKIFNELGFSIQNVWVIGNSIKSDINPALKLGLKAILIPRGTWKYEEETSISDKIAIVSSLTEAKKLILKNE
ncbi:MAG: hypothetical protein DRP41_01395 [Thermodesulfobacteriota bacterium]|nr:MAG: hypothetical protein DRP41_01395 [Thermodesulfobacteriota bacterium]